MINGSGGGGGGGGAKPSGIIPALWSGWRKGRTSFPQAQAQCADPGLLNKPVLRSYVVLNLHIRDSANITEM